LSVNVTNIHATEEVKAKSKLVKLICDRSTYTLTIIATRPYQAMNGILIELIMA
jgi:hypothetical protein